MVRLPNGWYRIVTGGTFAGWNAHGDPPACGSQEQLVILAPRPGSEVGQGSARAWGDRGVLCARVDASGAAGLTKVARMDDARGHRNLCMWQSDANR